MAFSWRAGRKLHSRRRSSQPHAEAGSFRGPPPFRCRGIELIPWRGATRGGQDEAMRDSVFCLEIGAAGYSTRYTLAILQARLRLMVAGLMLRV